ncbi:flagellar export chaperone FliS [Lysinimonas soli]|uniref:Flagellar export chaperone FliS n=1 Tax=Lysinimonas soli TaxID=1074233 RepID=A0ABW0NP75_9MICO
MSVTAGADARAAYVRDSVTSASPAHALVMLYDRLLLDLRWAERCQDTGDWMSASAHLIHAQDIIAELAGTLKPELWSGGPALMSLYVYLLGILRTGNAWRDIEPTREAIELLEPLRLAWHAATDGSAVPLAPTRLSAVG